MATELTLIEGWWRHKQSLGTKVHLLRMMAKYPEFVRTLCGQPWMRDAAQEVTQVLDCRHCYQAQCRTCLVAEPRWRAEDAETA